MSASLPPTILADRLAGTLLGTALGDALGLPAEDDRRACRGTPHRRP